MANFQEDQVMAFAPEAEATDAPGTVVAFGPETSPAIDPLVIQQRADRYDFAMGQHSPGKEAIAQALRAGSEKYLRAKLVTDESIRENRVRQMLAEDIYRATGGEPDAEQSKAISALTSRDLQTIPHNPESIVEKLYANRYMSMINDGDNSPYVRFARENPDRADDLVEAGSRVTAIQQVVRKRIEDVKERWKDASWGATISNYAEQVVPFFSQYNMRNAIQGAPKSYGLPGSNIEDQITYLYSQPVDVATQLLDNALAIMEAANPLDARNFLEAMIAYSRSDKFMDNAFGALDIASVTPIKTIGKVGKAVIGSVSSLEAPTKAAIREAVALGAKPNVKAVELLSPTGDTRALAAEYHAKMLNEASERAAKQGQQATWDDFLGKLVLIYNPKAALEGGELAKDVGFLNRLTEVLTRTSAEMIDGILREPINITRFDPTSPAFTQVIDDAIYRVSVNSPGLKDNLLYVKPGSQSDTLSGVVPLDVLFGTKGAQPFKIEKMAEWEIGNRMLQNAEVVPHGNGYAIQVRTVANEADPAFRKALVKTGEATPYSMANLFLSWARSSNDLLPADLVRDRTLAAFGMTKLVDLGRTMVGEVKQGMSKKSWDDFETFLKLQRDYTDPTTQLRGTFSKDLASFEMDWTKKFTRPPTEKEAEAYFRYVQISNMDLAIRSLQNHKNKASLGIEMVDLRITSPTPNPSFGNSIKVEGRIVRDDPFNSPDDFSFIKWGEGRTDEIGKQAYVSSAKRLSKDAREELKNKGLVPVQITDEAWQMMKANPELAPYLPKKQVDYLYMKNPKTSPLPINQVPDRPGGHVVYKDGFYLAQPEMYTKTQANVTFNYYKGDTILSHFVRESDAKKMNDLFNQARVLLKEAHDAVGKGPKAPAPNYGQLSDFLENQLGGLYKADDFAKLFYGEEKMFNPSRKFSIRPSGRTINDVENLSKEYPNFRIGNTDPHSVANVRADTAFTQKRGDPVPTFAWRGSPDKPVLERAPAELIDPMETLEGAFNSIIKSRYLDDLRIKTTERFINEFADVLDVPIQELRANPMAHLMDPVWKKGADPAVKKAAENMRRTMLEFMNIRTPLEREVQYVKQKLIDSVYSTVGEKNFKVLEDMKTWADSRTMGFTKDPLKFMRAFAFHEKLGLFNPKQLFLQAQNMTTVVALEGVNGFKGAATYPFIRGLMVNSSPEIVDYYAKQASKFGWTKDQFKESWDLGSRTGFFKVGGEFIDLGDASPAIVQSSIGKGLDHAAFFFREGERISRISAWNASYLKWRGANPTKTITDVDIGTILTRADLLNGNMSRASAATWQNGPVAVTTQFWSYQARMTDLMLGKRLDATEKARLIAGYSFMYGVPTGFAVTGAGLVWPWQEAATKYMVENGMAYDDSAVTRVLHEGVSGVISGVLYGERTNFSEGYSPQGLSVIKDLLYNEKKGFFDFIIGASGTVLKDNIKATTPFLMAVTKSFGADGGYPLTTRDFSDALSNVSTFSNLSKAYHAYYFQEYWSKKEQKLSSPREVTVAQAMIQAVSGIMPYEISQAYAMAASIKDRKAAQKEIWDEAVKNLRLAYKSSDVSEADKYFRRAQIHIESGQFTMKEKHQIMTQSARGYESMVDNVAQRYANTKQERLLDLLRKGD